MARKKSYDVFMSYASEDRSSFVESLALELRRRGLKVWFDVFELKVGDSLRESIERGLAKSRFGVVVFSPSFFKKKWPRKELNGLFSREMSGNKTRILPILHSTSIEAIKKLYPIQSDRIFLNSSMPLGDLCEKLIEVIKPKLIEARGLKERAFEVSDAFINAARKNYPGYGFGILNTLSTTPGNGNVKSVKIWIENPAAVTIPPVISIKFVGEGVRKADEFIRTGKPQKWTTGEFLSVSSAMPFFNEITQGEISVGTPANLITSPVSLRCGTAFFPYMLRKIVRGGTKEIELEVSSDLEPLKVTIIWSPSPKKKTFDLIVSWSIQGFSAKKILSMLCFIEQASKGNTIFVSDLKGEMPDLSLPLTDAARLLSPFDKESQKLIRLCAKIEDFFNLKLPMSVVTTEEDRQSLVILDSLLNGTEIDAKVSNSLALRRGENSEADKAVLNPGGLKFSLFTPVDNYRGFLPLFGVNVPTPLWGLGAESSLSVDKEDVEAYRVAPEGTEILLRFVNNGKARYRWASEFPKIVTDGTRTGNSKGQSLVP